MRVLITMAGKGSRFRNVGVTKPKHEITVKGKPMFDWAMQSLEAFFGEEFIFITQSSHNATKFLNNACDRLGIENFQEISLDNYTNGQAQTALKADKLLSQGDAVAIYNIDTYIKNNELSPEIISGDGFIPVFPASGTRWSFARIDDEGHICEVAEKEKISDNATAGFYYFDRWGDFIDAYEKSAESVEREFGETYVAPLYNYLIDRGHSIIPYQLSEESINILGTPDDLREFDSEFSPSHQ